MRPNDPNYSHSHPSCAAARQECERQIYKHILDTEKIYEIACSARTIRQNYRKMFFNRPLNLGFNGDINKLNMLRTPVMVERNNHLRQEGEHYCICIYENCDHKYTSNVIFSVDTLYYVWRSALHDLLRGVELDISTENVTFRHSE